MRDDLIVNKFWQIYRCHSTGEKLEDECSSLKNERLSLLHTFTVHLCLSRSVTSNWARTSIMVTKCTSHSSRVQRLSSNTWGFRGSWNRFPPSSSPYLLVGIELHWPRVYVFHRDFKAIEMDGCFCQRTVFTRKKGAIFPCSLLSSPTVVNYVRNAF